MEQWLVKMTYADPASHAYESEECWCNSKADAQDMAEALSVDYTDAHINILEARAGHSDRWVVNIWLGAEHESCEYLSLAEARQHAQSLFEDYGSSGKASEAQAITINGPHGWASYVLGEDIAIAV
ncbi:MAG: hypothetical protein WA324_05225 [Bryobacteraceae bacterium]